MASILEPVKNRLNSRSTAGFLLASMGLGILVGSATSALAVLINAIESGSASFEDWTGWGSWAFLALVPAGMMLSWLLNKQFGPGISGGGVSETMVGLSLHGGYLPTKQIIPKIVATAATLGSGGSGGREGPVVYIGAIIGSKLARMTNFDHDHIRSLVAAGAGAAIGASFNAPIAGMLFAMEVILSSFAIRHLNAVVIASVGAAVTTEILIGQELILTSPPHNLGDSRELILYAILALIAVAVGILYLKFEDLAATWRLSHRIPGWLKPVIYGLSVALIGVMWPDSLGTGLGYLNGLLRLEGAGPYLWWTLGLVALAKIVTSVLTREGGGSAGEFMASLVIGGSLGGAFGIIVQSFAGIESVDVGAFVVVGMAATLATTARAPLTAVILVFELTGNYGLVLPLMLAAALSTFLGDRFHPESAYTAKLLREGIALPTTEDIDLLDTVDVRDVMAPVDGTLHPWQTLAEAAEFFDMTSHHGAPVVNDMGSLVGVLSLSDIAKSGGPSMTKTIGEVMSQDPITITADAPVSMALARMASMGVGRLPVLSDRGDRKVIGMFRRVSVVNAYEQALSMSKGRELYRERKRIRSQPGADFFELTVDEGSLVANQMIADVTWPGDIVLVSIRRGSKVLVPHGDTTIRINDVLTVFGTWESEQQVKELTEATE
ncbi:MAG: CBS domain-containing protein [Proteobacteria bacterium]|nr:CBS domain-containing protein [Pseudomonadota bacterium]